MASSGLYKSEHSKNTARNVFGQAKARKSIDNDPLLFNRSPDNRNQIYEMDQSHYGKNKLSYR